MKITLPFALSAVLLAQPALADSKQQTADGLFRRAADTSGPMAVVKALYGLATGPIEGTYSRAWMSPNQWRREVSVPGFSEIAVSDGPSLGIERKPHLFQPQIVTRLQVDLELAADVRLEPNEKISKISGDTHGSARLQCIRIHKPNGMPSMSEKSLFFDESSDALVRIVDGQQRTEFSDFDSKDGALIARKVKQFRGKELAAEAELTSLGPQSMAAAGVLDHPADSRQFNTCDSNISVGKVLVRTNPLYPAAARAAHHTGTVEIYLVIDTDGQARDLEIIRGAYDLISAVGFQSGSSPRHS
jgi:hypothetical protein